MGMVQKLRYIFKRRDKIKLVVLLLMIIVGSFLELSGVAAFMPFIEIAMTPESIFENEWLSKM